MKEPRLRVVSGTPGNEDIPYPTVGLVSHRHARPKNWPIHRLIAIHYIPNPNNYKYVNHKDGDKYNFSIDNLEWCTQGDNQKHAYETGLKPRLNGTRNGRNKISAKDAVDIFNSSQTIYELAAAYDLDKSTINEIKRGSLWSSVTGMKYEGRNWVKLNDNQIREIYASKVNVKIAAKEFGVAESTIHNIRCGYTYSGITGGLFTGKRGAIQYKDGKIIQK